MALGACHLISTQKYTIGFSMTLSSPPFQQEWMPWPSTSFKICARCFSVSRSPGRWEFHGGQASWSRAAGLCGNQNFTARSC